MYISKHFTYLTYAYLIKRRCYNAKYLPYYFHVKANSINVVMLCFEFKLHYQILTSTLKFSTYCSNAADSEIGYFYLT